MKLRNLIAGVWLAVGSLAVPASALAKPPPEGVKVTVIVVDEAGAPIPTAVVRHPLEADRHRVNTVDGAFSESVLYLPDGTELKFLPGMELELEISAPGYVNRPVKYVIRKRKNVITVPLAKMELSLDEEELEDPMIQFAREKPIDGQSGDPSP